MALSVSSFPEAMHIPPNSELIEAPDNTPVKRRRIFGNLFCKDSSAIFKVPRRHHASKASLSLQTEKDTPVLFISAHKPPVDDVIDIPSTRKAKPVPPNLTVVTQHDSHFAPSMHHDQLVFPPTPVASQPVNPNPMKESIKALRLSRIHRPIDVGRKDEDALPPWASRGVIESFGHPGDYAYGDRDKDKDRDRSSSLLTPVSSWSASTPLSRPSASSAPSSRTSSMYFSSATSAISSPSPASTRPRTGTVPVVRHYTSSDASSSKGVERISFSSEKSTKVTAPSPPQLTGASTMRLRSLSTSSDKVNDKLKMKPALAIVPMTQSAPRKRSRTLSNTSDKGKGRTRTTSNVSSSAAESPIQRSRTRTLSGASDKGKGKAKGSRAASPADSIKSKKAPPIPPLPSIPSSTLRHQDSTSLTMPRPTSARTPNKFPSRSSRPRTKSAPSTPRKQGFDDLSADPPLPRTHTTIASADTPLILHSPSPISATASASFLRQPYQLPSQLRNLSAEKASSSGMSTPSTVWGLSDAAMNNGSKKARSPSRSSRPSMDRRPDTHTPPTVVIQDTGSGEWQEKGIGEVITQLRDMKMK
ncbi:hypothetical protein EW146_g8075 [Bondarzewia mesenterica]|uniref:Uncharacterized protein n=1 Tax=Bondarzewia mesenterica TaxID=1095465 RepID=A0A4S4LJ04_9AGAM|nr:hypothetical protein EW146_g8075 [Bondarzewia mesenterica]